MLVVFYFVLAVETITKLKLARLCMWTFYLLNCGDLHTQTEIAGPDGDHFGSAAVYLPYYAYDIC